MMIIDCCLFGTVVVFIIWEILKRTIIHFGECHNPNKIANATPQFYYTIQFHAKLQIKNPWLSPKQ